MKYRIPAPKKIQVGAKTYKVKIVDDLARFEGSRGDVCHNRLEIKIEKRMIPSEKETTFWHEVMHSIDQVFLAHSVDEKSIDALANGLHQVLQGMGIEIDWEK